MDLPDYTLFIQIANFLILIFLLNIIAYRPIRGILNKRREEMSSELKITEDWKQKTDKYSEELEENISNTKKEAMKEKDGLKGQALEEEREMLRETYESIEKNIEKSRSEIKKMDTDKR